MVEVVEQVETTVVPEKKWRINLEYWKSSIDVVTVYGAVEGAAVADQQ